MILLVAGWFSNSFKWLKSLFVCLIVLSQLSNGFFWPCCHIRPQELRSWFVVVYPVEECMISKNNDNRADVVCPRMYLYYTPAEHSSSWKVKFCIYTMKVQKLKEQEREWTRNLAGSLQLSISSETEMIWNSNLPIFSWCSVGQRLKNTTTQYQAKSGLMSTQILL